LEEQETRLDILIKLEVEYKVMAHTICEMIWLNNLMMEFDFRQPGSMLMHCDNQLAILCFMRGLSTLRLTYHLIRDT